MSRCQSTATVKEMVIMKLEVGVLCLAMAESSASGTRCVCEAAARVSDRHVLQDKSPSDALDLRLNGDRFR